MRGKSRAKVPMIIFFGLLFLTVFTYVVMFLWNAILPDVLNAKPINFWQSLGLLVLSKILFSGFGGWGHKKRYWRERMHEKWHHMSPEEREKFKEEWKHRCGWKAQWVRQQEGQPGAEGGSDKGVTS